MSFHPEGEALDFRDLQLHEEAKSGYFGQTEWRYTMSSDKTRQDFDEIDADGDGYITASELLTASVKEGSKISDDNIVAIIKMTDSDGDNKISYEEYVKFVR